MSAPFIMYNLMPTNSTQVHAYVPPTPSLLSPMTSTQFPLLTSGLGSNTVYRMDVGWEPKQSIGGSLKGSHAPVPRALPPKAPLPIGGAPKVASPRKAAPFNYYSLPPSGNPPAPKPVDPGFVPTDVEPLPESPAVPSPPLVHVPLHEPAVGDAFKLNDDVELAKKFYLENPSMSPTDYGKSPIEFVRKIIEEQDADIASDKEYLGLVRYLIGDRSKYDLFCDMYPNNTIACTLRITTQNKDVYRGGKWYEDAEKNGARIDVENGDPELLSQMVASQLFTSVGVGIMLEYDNHANAIWISKDLNIWRYEPQALSGSVEQMNIDGALSSFFKIHLPTSTYHPHDLDCFQCVQHVRGRDRIHKTDYFCQDYSLLYMIRRINGEGHDEAANKMVTMGDAILVDLETLMLNIAICYRRAQQGTFAM